MLKKAWEDTWQKAGLVMVSDTVFNDQNQEPFKLAQRLYSSFFNLYSAIPFQLTSASDGQFYGLSPGEFNFYSLFYYCYRKLIKINLIQLAYLMEL